MTEKKAGFAKRTARVTKREGRANVRTITGDLGEYRSETFEQAVQRLGRKI